MSKYIKSALKTPGGILKPKLNFSQEKRVASIPYKNKDYKPQDDNSTYYKDETEPIMPVTENLPAPPSPLRPQFGPKIPATYRPVLFMYDIQNNNYIYNPVYSNIFIDFLRNKRITCNAKTKIYMLKEQIKLMFLLMFNKTVIETIFSRNNIQFKNKNRLGNYSHQIEAWDNNIKDFF